ncbi:MAG: hypothetical protein GY851_08750 [bacterium]|nr:hypothetical protein [bacterium]
MKNRMSRFAAWALVVFYAVAVLHNLGPLLSSVGYFAFVPGIGELEECCHGHHHEPTRPSHENRVRRLADTCPLCALLQSDNIVSTGCPVPDGLAANVTRVDVPDLPEPRASRWRLFLVRAPPLSSRQSI